MFWIEGISLLLMGFYALLLLIYAYGWIRIPTFQLTDELNNQLTFTILVPARNEEHTIEKCLTDIIHQQYDKGKFEIVVINDHSTDLTKEKVEAFIKQHASFNILLLNMQDDPAQRKLKKAAITHGVSQAKNDYIILTDADCERKEKWLHTINAFINAKHSKMIYAPVVFKANNTFERIQSLEFAGLVGIGASAIQLKQPNMCSAANLIFERNVFDEVEGYKGYDGIASGDDEFLMHKVFKRYPDRVHFLKHFDAIVHTSANTSIKQLTDQRRRWVSKSTKYENRYITAILVAAYLFNAFVLLNLLFNFKFGLLMLGVKTMVELSLFLPVLRFFKRESYILLIPFAEIFHIVYVLVIGIWANMGTYNWKGREVR